jgi:hypothetical protein
MPKPDSLSKLLLTTFDLLLDALRFIRVSLRPRCALAAENLWVAKTSFALNSGKLVAVVKQAAGDRSAVRLAER